MVAKNEKIPRLGLGGTRGTMFAYLHRASNFMYARVSWLYLPNESNLAEA